MLVTVEQLRNYVATHHRAIKAKLAHVRGGVEMNVRMIHTLTTSDTLQESKNNDGMGPGTAFLLEKRKAILAEETGSSEKALLSAWLREKLGDLINFHYTL
jgi:hypothetical protein